MKKYYGHPKFYKILEEVADLHSRKNNNYAKINDPLSNLKEAKEFGLPAWIGVLLRMGDKWSRIKELVKGKQDLVGESIKETLMDLAVYSILAIILFEEDEQ